MPAGVVGLSGSVTLASPLGSNFSGGVTPTAASFTDGASTLTLSNTSSNAFFFVTNPSGAIINWEVFMCMGGGPGCNDLSGAVSVTQLFSFNLNTGIGSPTDQSFYIVAPSSTQNFALNAGLPGTWTSSSPVVTPEPSSLILLGSGLLGILGAARRKLLG